MARFDRTIPPGGEGNITLEMRTKGYQGKMHKTARVMTNDPKNPQMIIGMKGMIWTPIQLKPRYVHLKGTVGDEIEQVLHIRGEKKEPLTLKLASVSIPTKVAVELKEVDKGRSYQLKVKNKVAGAVTYGGELKLTTNYPEKPELVIRISGNVRAPIEARPKVLNFGRLSEERVQQATTKGRFMKRPVMVILNKGKDLKVNKVELEKALFNVAMKEMSRGRTVQLLVEPISEKLKKGQNVDTLKIYTNQKECEILEVPIRIEIF